MSPVEQIKDRLSVAEVLGSYIELVPAGANFKAKCPFHNEKTPSFFISPERGTYYCFGCNAKGDIFTFVEQFEGLDFKGALKTLAERAGVELVASRSAETSVRDRIYETLEAATKVFQEKLESNSEARAYLVGRGLTDKTIAEWRLGFAPNEWREIKTALGAKGFSESELEQAGLIKRTDAASYDRFRGRIMFPLFDSSGRVVAFTGRTLSSDKDVAKYLNSPETEVFSKSRLLYGFHKAKLTARKFGYIVFVEGQMDLLHCHQAGFTNTVAVSGTALTEEHLRMIKRLTNKVLMAFDGDAAGFKAAAKAHTLALALQMEVKVARPTDGKDAADVIMSAGAEAWKAVLRDSVHLIDRQLELILERGLDTRKLALAVRDELLPYVALVESSVERSYFIKTIAGKTGISETALWEDIKRAKLPEAVALKGSDGAFAEKEVLMRRDKIIDLLIGLVASERRKEKPLLDAGKLEEDLVRILGPDRKTAAFAAAEPRLSELIFEAEMHYGAPPSVAKIARELSLSLEEEMVREEFAGAMRDLSKAEQEKDEGKIRDLLAVCQDKGKRLNELKKLIAEGHIQ